MYTHNLKIILFDEHDNLLTGRQVEGWLTLIKQHLLKAIKFDDGKTYIMNWQMVNLSTKAALFMGDLFAYSIYGADDAIVVKHVEKSLQAVKAELKVPGQWQLEYYVHRLAASEA